MIIFKCCSVVGPVLRVSRALPHSVPTKLVPVIQAEKLRLEEVKEPAPSQLVSTQARNWTPFAGLSRPWSSPSPSCSWELRLILCPNLTVPRLFGSPFRSCRSQPSSPGPVMSQSRVPPSRERPLPILRCDVSRTASLPPIPSQVPGESELQAPTLESSIGLA